MLAAALAELPGVEIDVARVRTNIVVFGVGRELFADGLAPGLDPVDELLGRLAGRGVLGARISETRARLVTHRDVTRAQVERAVEVVRSLAG